MPKEDRIQDRFDTWPEPYRADAHKIYSAHKQQFRTFPSSKAHHGAYEGGLYDHTDNVMQCVRVLYTPYMSLLREHPFTVEKAEYTAFLHDFGKIPQQTIKPFKMHYFWIFDMLKDLDIEVDDEMVNALFHHHGGWGPSGELNPLAVFIHACDMWASQVMEK